jgi:hypothetical protein
MQTYPYLWLPFVVVFGTAVVLTNAYLALIVVIFLGPVLLLGVAAAILAVPYLLVRFIVRKLSAPASAHPAWSTERHTGGVR